MPPPPHDLVSEPGRIKLEWLVKLHWIAILGESAAIVGVQAGWALVNIGNPDEFTIRELAQLVGFNNGEWIAADPSDGAWDSLTEAYNVQLPGTAGATNTVEIAILDRWDQQVYFSPEPVQIEFLDSSGHHWTRNEQGLLARPGAERMGRG